MFAGARENLGGIYRLHGATKPDVNTETIAIVWKRPLLRSLEDIADVPSFDGS